jgi:hypothetical protein
MIIGLTSIGLSGLGIPYVLPIGMWGLAAGTALTLYQRMRAVYVDAKSQAAASPAAPTAPQPTAAPVATGPPASTEPPAPPTAFTEPAPTTPSAPAAAPGAAPTEEE